MKNIFIKTVILLLFFSTKIFSQDTLAFSKPLEQLSSLGDSLLKSKSDSVRLICNEKFSSLLDSILSQPNSTSLSFYQVRALSIAISPDHKFRIFNWMMIQQQQNKNSFYGSVEIFPSEKVKRKIYKLTEKRYQNNQETELLKLDTATWLGCIYYKIIHHYINKKDEYILLGWAPQSTFTTRKIIEPISINSNKIVFGAPIIKTGGRAKMRMIFEFNAQTSMTLRYEEEKNRIIFDNLSSTDSRPESRGMYNLYGPDFSYNALLFKDGYWTMGKDVETRNQGKNEGKQGELKKFEK
jgi:hypothetical protein